MVAEKSSDSLRYRIVPYDAEHRSLVVDLQRELWSPDVALNAAYLDWKYLRNPYIPRPLIYLAFCGDELAGMRGAVGTRWEIGDRREHVTLPYPDDLVIAPAHRARWLHQRIMAFALKDLSARGYEHVVNLSAGRTTAAGSMKMRWRSAGSVLPIHRQSLRKKLADRLVNRIRHMKFVWRCADDLSRFCLPPADRVFERLEKRFPVTNGSPSGQGVFLEKSPLVREMAQLVERLPRNGRIRHLRDETYLAWRYGNPLRSYRFLYSGSERLNGYLVLQRSLGSDTTRVSIVDWEADDDLVRRKLLDAAIEGDFPELFAWTSGIEPAAAKMFERCGFVQVRSGFETNILVRSVHEEDLKRSWLLCGRPLDDQDNWDLRMIYSMAG